MSIFGEETIPVPGSSPEEGHDETTAVETEELEAQSDFETDETDDAEADVSEEDLDEEGADPQEGHSDELLAGKYKTPRDLAAAYLNAQRMISKQAEEIRNMRQQTGQQPPQLPATQVQDGQPDFDQVFWDRFRESPFKTMQAFVQHIVSQQTAPIFEERRESTISQHLNAIAAEYRQVGTEEGFNQLFSKVQEIATEMGNPGLIDNPTPRILRLAAQEAFGDTKAQVYEKAKQAGRAEAERARQSKQGLGGPNGARRGADPQPSEEDQIRAGIVAAGRSGGLFS